MSISSQLRTRLLPGFTRLRSILRDRRGVAAVEFAFIVPVLLCGYFITMEASQGIEVNRKVSRMGYTTADLITQQTAMTKAELKAIMEIGKAIIQPYHRSLPSLEVTAIQFGTQAEPVATVAWSMKLDAAGNPVKVLTKGSTITPNEKLAKLRTAGAFYIAVRARLSYEPVITWSPEASSVGLLSAFNDIQMGETFYLRPRHNINAINCADCP